MSVSIDKSTVHRLPHTHTQTNHGAPAAHRDYCDSKNSTAQYSRHLGQGQESRQERSAVHAIWRLLCSLIAPWLVVLQPIERGTPTTVGKY
jgi:hypothetical protein